MSKKINLNLQLSQKYKIILSLLLIVTAVYMFLSFTSFLFTWQTDISKMNLSFFEFFSDSTYVKNHFGKLGAALAMTFMYNMFGLAAYGLVALLLLLGIRLLGVKINHFGLKVFHIVFVMFMTSLTLAFLFGQSYFNPGGGYGNAAVAILRQSLGSFGAFILIAIAWFVYLMLTFEGFYNWITNSIANLSNNKITIPKFNINQFLLNLSTEKQKSNEQSENQEQEQIIDQQELNPFDEIEQQDQQPQQTNIKKFVIKDDGQLVDPNSDVEFEVDFNNTDKPPQYQAQQDKSLDLTVEIAENVQVDEVLQDYDPTKSLKNYRFPPVDLLNDYSSQIDRGAMLAEINKKKKKIVEVLKQFKIDIEKIKAKVGPTVTLYEIIPAPGVPINKIKRLAEDIAMRLSALGIRIIAPMPGRGTIGIEVPNEKRAIVSFKEMILSPEFQGDKFELPIALGKDVVNQPFVFDLANAPHVLMAGSTGEGKSVAINVIINSLLFKKHPALVKFVMIDPKQVELSLYSKLRNHYLATLPEFDEPIVTEVRDASRILKSLITEMEDRYRLLKLAHVRNIKEYNQKFIKRKIRESDGHRFLPYIVVIIDEFADLVMVGGKEIEYSITRLSQKARAIGIHLVIATQRPSTDVITGLIKNNFPTRIALKVMSVADSKTIIDTTGANQLVGKGDMLYLYGSNITRLQCAFIDTEEVERITDFIYSQPGYPEPYYLPEPAEEEEGAEEKVVDLKKKDRLFEDVARFVVSQQKVSISLIQRKFEIGFNRAARIVDQLEAAGIVGQSIGNKGREVLISDLDELESILQSLR